MHGLADAQQAQTAASYAAAGAKAGSIVPGIGTVIGAVVGAVVGWLSTKKKPPRASAEQVAQCKSLLDEYMGYAAQMPDTPIPLELQDLRDLHWCIAAVYGAEVKLRDPRYFLAGFDVYLSQAKRIVRTVYETPVGQTVNLESVTWKDPKGRTISTPKFNFVNQPFITIRELTTRTLLEYSILSCEPYGGSACRPWRTRDVIARLEFDTLGYAARTELPNISESDLHAASQVAQQTGTASSDVVKAVEQIMGRTVTSGETSAILAPVTTPVPITSPPSIPTPSTTLPTTPATAPVSPDLSAMISQLLAQGASQTQALQALQTQGIATTPAVQQAIATQTNQAGVGGSLLQNPWIVGIGAALALTFALARPARR